MMFDASSEWSVTEDLQSENEMCIFLNTSFEVLTFSGSSNQIAEKIN
jgi:hypothetical protein